MMDENKLVYNECSPLEESVSIELDTLKMLEFSEAIHDLDNKLTNLEIALNMNRPA